MCGHSGGTMTATGGLTPSKVKGAHTNLKCCGTCHWFL